LPGWFIPVFLLAVIRTPDIAQEWLEGHR